MFNREEKDQYAERAVVEATKQLETKISSFRDEAFAPPSEITQILNRLGGLFPQLDRAYRIVSQTPTLDDDLKVITEQDRLLGYIESKVRGVLGMNPTASRIIELANSRMRLSRALNAPVFTEVEKNSAVQAISQLRSVAGVIFRDAALMGSNADLNLAVNDIISTAQTKFTDSKIADTEPLFQNLVPHDLTSTINEVDSTVFTDGTDATDVESMKRALRGFAAKVAKDEDNEMLTGADEKKLETQFLPRVRQLFVAYDGDKVALREAEKLEQILYEIQHEQRVSVLGGSDDPKRDFLRPSRVQDVPAEMEGLIEMMLGLFKSKIDRAEAIGRIIANESLADRPRKVNDDDRTFLNDLKRDFDREIQRQVLGMKQAMDLGEGIPLGRLSPQQADNREYVENFIDYTDKYSNWLEKLIDDTAVNVVPPPPVDVKGDLLNVEIQKMDEDELFKYGKQLLPKLNDNKTTYTSPSNQAKRTYDEKLTETITRLKTMGERGVRRADYLRDRLVMGTAVFWASSSGFSMNYENLTTGAPPDWVGAKVPGEFGEKNIMRLLEGSNFDRTNLVFDRVDDTKNVEERERVETIKKVLDQACKLFSHVDINIDARGNVTKFERGPFHATTEFDDSQKTAFQKELKTRLFGARDLSPAENEAFDLGIELMVFLDLRTYYYLPFYATGFSPPSDTIGNTVGETAKECNPLAYNSAVIAGKSNGYVNYYNTVQEFSPEINAVVGGAKLQNFEFSRLATSAWWSLYAEPMHKDIIYSLPFGVNPIPTFAEAFFRPPRPEWVTKLQRARGITPAGDTDVPPFTYNAIKQACLDTDKRDPRIAEKTVNLFAYLTGLSKLKVFSEQLEKATPIAGNIHETKEAIRQAFVAINKAFSPTKALPTIDVRFNANLVYNYARQTSLLYTYQEDHLLKEGKASEYWAGYAEVMETMANSLKKQDTLSLEIPKYYLDLSPGLVHDFHMPTVKRKINGVLTDTGNVRLMDYVLALLPHSRKFPLVGSITRDHHHSITIAPTQASAPRYRNNMHLKELLSGDFGFQALEKFKANIKGQQYSNEFRQFGEDRQESQELWSLVAFPALAAKKEQEKPA